MSEFTDSFNQAQRDLLREVGEDITINGSTIRGVVEETSTDRVFGRGGKVQAATAQIFVSAVDFAPLQVATGDVVQWRNEEGKVLSIIKGHGDRVALAVGPRHQRYNNMPS